MLKPLTANIIGYISIYLELFDVYINRKICFMGEKRNRWFSVNKGTFPLENIGLQR
jgi:hypothetical protein